MARGRSENSAPAPDNATAQTGAAAAPTEQAPADTPATPTTPPTQEYRGRNPFHRTVINTEDQNHGPHDPNTPSTNIERESQEDRNRDIARLIESIRSGQWEADQESDRLQRRYGDRNLGSAWNRMRMWLGGESDFTFNEQTGTMDHNIDTEVLRRGANIAWKTGKTAAMALLIGAATGGTGALLGGALLGSAAGRTVAESWKGFSGHENRMRERLAIARVRYYQKARELAAPDIIGPEEPENRDQMTDQQVTEYYQRRNAAIADLVNFVYNSEQHSIDFHHTANRAPFVGAPQEAAPNEPGEVNDNAEAGEVEEVVPANPAVVTGTDVFRSSDFAHSRWVLDDMERDFEHYRRRWEIIEEGLALAGGIGGGIYSFLSAKAQIAQEMGHELARGKIVEMDIDGNGVTHGVQKINEATKNALGIIKDYIFHYGSDAEKLQALADKATVLQPEGAQHGAHILQESFKEMIAKASTNEARQGAIAVLSALAGRFGWRLLSNELAHIHNERERNDMKQQQELNRQRFLPDAQVAEAGGAAGTEGGTPAGGPDQPDQARTSENQEQERAETRETDRRDIGQYQTAAEHRHPENLESSNETYTFCEVRGNQQMMISLTKRNRTALNINLESLKQTATQLVENYGNLNDIDVTDQNMRDAIQTISAQIPNEISRDVSWTILVTTQEGRFYGYRFNDDRSQLFRTDNTGRVIIESKDRNAEGHVTRSNSNFYTGILERGNTLALLDETLSRDRINDRDNANTIRRLREEILSGTAGTDFMARELIDRISESSGNAEYNAIISKFAERLEEARKAPREAILSENLKLYKEGKEAGEISLFDGLIFETTEGTNVDLWELKEENNKLKITPFEYDPDTEDLKYFPDSLEFENADELQHWLQSEEAAIIYDNKEEFIQAKKTEVN